MEKRCTLCAETKPIADFGKRAASKDGAHVHCKACRKLEHVSYYERNRDAVLAKNAAWREQNPELARGYVREHHRRWRSADPAGYRDYMRKYRTPELNRAYAKRDYEQHRVARLAAGRRWKSDNANAVKASAARWKAVNKERVSALKRSYKARKKGAIGSHTGADVMRLYRLQRGRCACCVVCLAAGYQVDHIHPLALGGTNAPNNLQLLCARCNRAKWKKHPIDFARERGMLI